MAGDTSAPTTATSATFFLAAIDFRQRRLDAVALINVRHRRRCRCHQAQLREMAHGDRRQGDWRHQTGACQRWRKYGLRQGRRARFS